MSGKVTYGIKINARRLAWANCAHQALEFLNSNGIAYWKNYPNSLILSTIISFDDVNDMNLFLIVFGDMWVKI